ncbi:MAG: sugar ABC transporter permease [Anaerolineae bacterium]|nr:sugar ABC transporter permease [Anaerolineae bacterium]
MQEQLTSVPTAAVRPLAARKGQARFRWQEVSGFLFVVPWLVGFLAFEFLPFLASFALSFTDWSLGREVNFIGLQNYRDLLQTEPLLRKGIINTVYYTVFHVPGQMILAFVVAVLLNQKVRGMPIYRTAYYLPSVTSGVASAIIWIWLFQPSGIINRGLALFGIEGPNWLVSTRWAMPALIIMGFWTIGTEMVLYLAGLQGVPESLYEAAEIDGAGRWHRVRHVTIPLMTPYFFLTAVLGIISSFQVFTPALVMTQGGPGDATVFLLLFLYWAGWEWFRMGYASAIAWVLMGMIMTFTALQFWLQRYWVYYEFQ